MAGKKGKKKAAQAKNSGATTPVEEPASKAPSDTGDDVLDAVKEEKAAEDDSKPAIEAQGLQSNPSEEGVTGTSKTLSPSEKADEPAGSLPVEENNEIVTEQTIDDSRANAQQYNESVVTNGAIRETPSPDAVLREALEEQTARAERLQQEKSASEAQYRNLLSKVTQMKATLGARIKEDSEELAQNKVQIEDLVQQNAGLSETVAQLTERVEALTLDHDKQDKTTSALTTAIDTEKRRREQAELALVEAQKTYEAAKERQLMQISDWETIALEERAARDQLRERIAELEEQVAMSNQGYASLRSVAEQDATAIQAYKTTIHEMQSGHQTQLRDTAEKMQATIDGLEDEKQVLLKLTDQLQAQIVTLQEEIAKLRPHESEVKEKTLLIGKLRHEAVILNEHLTKALRLLKRGSSNDAVDRQLLSNLLISFLTIPRQDSKRFEVLKIVASVLSWTDEQKEMAGLLRPGSTSAVGLSPVVSSPTSSRSPLMSPSAAFPGGGRPGFFGQGRRSSSSAQSLHQLQAADFIGRDNASMSELWINFLEKSSEIEPKAGPSGATSPVALRTPISESPSPAIRVLSPPN